MKFKRFSDIYLVEDGGSVNQIKPTPSPNGGSNTQAPNPSPSSSVMTKPPTPSGSAPSSVTPQSPSPSGSPSSSSSVSQQPPTNSPDSSVKQDPPSKQMNTPSNIKEQLELIRAAGLETINKVNPKVMDEAVNKYIDMRDYRTARIICSLNEGENNSLLLDLTGKLYKMIIGKIDEVEFGEIPNTRGDITRLSKYSQLKECIQLLHDIFKQYHEDTEPVKVLDNALSNIENHADIFQKCFIGNIDLGIIMYNTMTLSVINGISYMIAVCIEYIKDPKNEGLKIAMNKAGVAKVKDYLVYENLVKFNTSCSQGDVRNSLEPLVRQRAKGFLSLGALALGVKTVLVLGGVLLAIVPMLKDLVYFFFSARTRLSNYLNVQADLLEMNAKELQMNKDIPTQDDRDSVIRKQLNIARLFHQTADKIAVDVKQAEQNANRELRKDNEKYNIDQVDTNPNPTTNTSQEPDGSLF